MVCIETIDYGQAKTLLYHVRQWQWSSETSRTSHMQATISRILRAGKGWSVAYQHTQEEGGKQ